MPSGLSSFLVPGPWPSLTSLRQHVGVLRYGAFLRQVYDLLDDNGIFLFQVAGFRPNWQFEDLIWYVSYKGPHRPQRMKTDLFCCGA